jgi:hypothetical protein
VGRECFCTSKPLKLNSNTPENLALLQIILGKSVCIRPLKGILICLGVVENYVWCGVNMIHQLIIPGLLPVEYCSPQGEKSLALEEKGTVPMLINLHLKNFSSFSSSTYSQFLDLVDLSIVKFNGIIYVAYSKILRLDHYS